MRQAEDGKIAVPGRRLRGGDLMSDESPNMISRLAGQEGDPVVRPQAVRAGGHQGPQHHPDDGHDDHHPGLPPQVLLVARPRPSPSIRTSRFRSRSTQLKPKMAVTVTVTKKVILVEGDGIAPINAAAVDPAVKRDGENGYYITPLVEILEKHARREKKVAELTGPEVRGPAHDRRRPDDALPPADRESSIPAARPATRTTGCWSSSRGTEPRCGLRPAYVTVSAGGPIPYATLSKMSPR